MSRAGLAALIGVLGFLAYVALVIVVADAIIGTHWLVELAYFAAAGVLWVFPARALLLWGAGR
ncbi:MAG: DUF2842 domain-containing protein [Rhodovarius sp.]|nr:DUF2842 domain-containing protein [Rhodovarius sp.]MCX7932576.1 DUF2842 domain-containing protein [Rhodovarius sp.]MDW8313593.1 DUF2842 domain-containing protein [Rhodovarius sp.]